MCDGEWVRALLICQVLCPAPTLIRKEGFATKTQIGDETSQMTGKMRCQRDPKLPQIDGEEKSKLARKTYLLELLDDTLVDATALVNQVTRL